MPSRRIRAGRRTLWAASAALIALAYEADAKDVPATPEGAARISAFFSTYAGKAAAPPALVVTPEGSDYRIAADIGALTASLESVGVNYDSSVFTFKAFEQDDGLWRVELDSFPTYHVQMKQKDATSDMTVTVSGVHSTTLLDPVMDWIRSSQGEAEKLSVRQIAPGLDGLSEGGPVQAALTSQASPGGDVASSLHETFGALSMTMAVDPKAANPPANPAAKPFNVAFRIDSGSLDAKWDGIEPHPLLDLWAFWVAHPSRPELAGDEAKFKTLLTAAVAARTSLIEDFGVAKLAVQTPQGSVTSDAAKFGFSVAATGPASRYEQRISATGLSFPAALIPAEYRDFVPSSFDIDVKVSGFDLTAAGMEAIADMHLAGDAPPLSPEDRAKVGSKLRGDAPMVIDIPASHVRAPQLDVGFEGQIRYVGAARPVGAITLHARNFDRTVDALKALGPDAERKMVPIVAMAKGLAKTDPDGVLTWVCQVGDDRIMKVNGLPLGKAPF